MAAGGFARRAGVVRAGEGCGIETRGDRGSGVDWAGGAAVTDRFAAPGTVGGSPGGSSIPATRRSAKTRSGTNVAVVPSRIRSVTATCRRDRQADPNS